MDDAQLEAIRRLLALADAYHLRELVVEQDGISVTIRGDVPTAAPAPGTADGFDLPPLPVVMEPDEEPLEEEAFHPLRSPMTGIFYRSPSPESPPYVVEGQTVEEGQTVGMIEAMKVFSEIPADVPGRVVRVVADSGKLLQEGDVLMLIDTGEEH